MWKEHVREEESFCERRKIDLEELLRKDNRPFVCSRGIPSEIPMCGNVERLAYCYIAHQRKQILLPTCFFG